MEWLKKRNVKEESGSSSAWDLDLEPGSGVWMESQVEEVEWGGYKTEMGDRKMETDRKTDKKR